MDDEPEPGRDLEPELNDDGEFSCSGDEHDDGADSCTPPWSEASDREEQPPDQQQPGRPSAAPRMPAAPSRSSRRSAPIFSRERVYGYPVGSRVAVAAMPDLHALPVPAATDIACWHCVHPFQGHPVSLPTGLDSKRRWRCVGIFCSWACAKAYCIHDGSEHLIRSAVQWLWSLYKKTTGRKDSLVPAPPRHALKLFGGHMTIDEFRRASPSGMLVVEHWPPSIMMTAAYEEVRRKEAPPPKAAVHRQALAGPTPAEAARGAALSSASGKRPRGQVPPSMLSYLAQRLHEAEVTGGSAPAEEPPPPGPTEPSRRAPARPVALKRPPPAGPRPATIASFLNVAVVTKKAKGG